METVLSNTYSLTLFLSENQVTDDRNSEGIYYCSGLLLSIFFPITGKSSFRKLEKILKSKVSCSMKS